MRANVPRGAPLIGFAGGPFTLFCYLVCGRPSKEFGAARSFLYSNPESSERLLDKLADAMAAYMRAQVAAGAQALMLFESWAGLLGPREFERFALRAVKRVFAGLKNVGVPLIYYANNGGSLLDQIAGARCGRRRHRLAHAAQRRPQDARAEQGRAGQSRSGRAVRIAGGVEAARGWGAGGGGPQPGSHLQPRPRHLAGNRSGRRSRGSSTTCTRPRRDERASRVRGHRVEVFPRPAGAHRRVVRELRAVEALPGEDAGRVPRITTSRAAARCARCAATCSRRSA